MKKFIVFLFAILFYGNFVFANEVLILHTSDVHGRISPIEYYGLKSMGGFSKRLEYVNSLREKNNVLLLDSGDYFQGSLYYRLFKGQISAKLLPLIKYDAIALGNHEFDDGTKILKRNIKKSKTQFISCNVHFKDKYLRNKIKPYIIKEFDGEKYLIIGATTSNLSSLSFGKDITVTNPSKEIQKIIKSVKHDKVIVVSHCGKEEDFEIARNNPEIDLILGGHNHYFFNKLLFVNNVPIIQDGEFGIRIGQIKINDNKPITYSFKNITPEMNSNYYADKIIKKVNKKISKKQNIVLAKTNTKLIGEQNTIEHQQTNLGKLVLMSMVQNYPDYDVVLTNSGSIRINRNIKDKITYADILELLPFENGIVEVRLLGKDLKKILKHGEQTNRRYLQYHFKNNTPINDNKYYNVVTNAYIASGHDEFTDFKNGVILKTDKTPHIKLFSKFIKNFGVITEEKIDNL